MSQVVRFKENCKLITTVVTFTLLCRVDLLVSSLY